MLGALLVHHTCSSSSWLALLVDTGTNLALPPWPQKLPCCCLPWVAHRPCHAACHHSLLPGATAALCLHH
jgi:hypothetical protein